MSKLFRRHEPQVVGQVESCVSHVHGSRAVGLASVGLSVNLFLDFELFPQVGEARIVLFNLLAPLLGSLMLGIPFCSVGQSVVEAGKGLQA